MDVLVAESWPALCNLMVCGPPGSSVRGNSPGKNPGVGCYFLLQGIFQSQELNLRLLHWQAGSLPLAPPAAGAAQSLQSCQTFVTLWTVTRQALLSMGFSRQEYWRGLPYPPPGHLPHPGIEPVFLILLHWQMDSLPLALPEKPPTFL